MTTLEDHLNRIYFDPGHPASFSGPKKLYGIVKKDGYHPTLNYIKQWVQDQEAYSIFKPARKKFQRNRVVVKGRDALWDIDLADLQDIAEDNDGIKYLLVCIDVFSKYLWVRPLPSKTGKDVKNAIEDILKGGRKGERIRTDKGREFNNTLVKSFFEKEGIKYSSSSNETKANYSERVIKTLKNKVYRYLTNANSRRYVDVLQDLVKSYNNSVHRTIKTTPNKVTKKKSQTLWWEVYEPKSTYKKKPFTFRIGDSVRVSFLPETFDREYSQSFSGEIFEIVRRYRRSGIPVYGLKDYNGEPVTGTFYAQELQKVTSNPDKTWKVEKVLKTRKRKGKTEYFVKWHLWPSKFNSWVQDLEDL